MTTSDHASAHLPEPAMIDKYETRVTRLTVLPAGERTFCELATEVMIDDEAGGEFVVLSQEGRNDGGRVSIDPDEWPTLRKAIDRMIAECRSSP